MPDRILRANILTSETITKVTWQGEVFYRRLMSIVDDFGRHDARVPILRSSLYPLQLDKVSEPDIVKWLGECSKAGLVRCYTVSGKDYLEIQNFNQRLRSAKSKYPPPADIGGQLSANDSRPRPNAESESESESETYADLPAPQKSWNTKPGETEMSLSLPDLKTGAVIELFRFTKGSVIDKTQVERLWQVFKIQNFTGEKFYQSQNEVYKHFINWSKTQDAPKSEPEKAKPVSTAAPLKRL